MSKPRNNTNRLKISSGQGNLGRVKNAEMSWWHLKDQLRVPTKDALITFGGYMELPKEGPGGQDDGKQRPGFLVGGPCENGKRNLAHMGKRWLLALDIDEATAVQMKWFDKRKSPIWNYEFFAHTTRKHCQQKPRWRFLFPITRPVGFDEFNAVRRIVASHMFKTVEGRITAIRLFQQNIPFLISLVHSHLVILSGARPHNRGQPNYACLEPTVVRLIAMQRKAAVECLADICCFRAVLAKSSPIRR
jgi:hypothetical protein